MSLSQSVLQSELKACLICMVRLCFKKTNTDTHTKPSIGKEIKNRIIHIFLVVMYGSFCKSLAMNLSYDPSTVGHLPKTDRTHPLKDLYKNT